jgi:tetratricopeptide (TPR) repeat protein
MKSWNRIFAAAIRLLVVGACLIGIHESWKFYRSDESLLQGKPESIRAAIRLEPDCWWCYVQLARLDEKDAEELLQASLRLNAYNGESAIDLGLRYESDGDFRRAENLLLQAFAVDRTYGSRWSLANFYFRRDNLPEFWTWARRAAEMPAIDIRPLFELSWRVAPEPKTIEANLIDDDPFVIRQYIEFLVGKNLTEAAVHPALRLIHTGSTVKDRGLYFGLTDRDRILGLIDRLIDANDAPNADSLWRELIRQHAVVADTSVPNNPEFSRDPMPVKFDWSFSAFAGLHSWPGSSGLIAEFTGVEPESCTIVEQTISLRRGNYRLVSSYRWQNIAANTGIRWQIVDAKSGAVVVSSPSLSSDSLSSVTIPFSVGPDVSLLRLQLVYRRELGTPRVAGTLVIPSIRIQALSQT